MSMDVVCTPSLSLPTPRRDAARILKVEEDEEEGRHQAQFSLQRYPEEVFGDSDSDAKIYPVTELDPEKVTECDSASTLGNPDVIPTLHRFLPNPGLYRHTYP